MKHTNEVSVEQSEDQSRQLGLVKDDGDLYSAELELPGFSKENLEISVTHETMKIVAKREGKQKNYKIQLHDRISIHDIQASMEHGLLRISLPKKTSKEDIKIPIK
jgi:HSP20 family molecular chaperone IbpA